MLKQTIEFIDFNGEQRKRDLYFNLTEAELIDMQVDSELGIEHDMQEAIKEKNVRKLLDFVKMLVERSYGERSPDGIHFDKTPEITQRFINSAMYSPLLMSLFQQEGQRTAEFITGLMPPDLIKRAQEQAEGRGTQSAPVGLSAREQFAARQQDTQSVFERDTSEFQGTGFNEAPTIGLATGGGNPVMQQPERVEGGSLNDQTARQLDDIDESRQHPFRQPESDEEKRTRLAAEERGRQFEEWRQSQGYTRDA